MHLFLIYSSPCPAERMLLPKLCSHKVCEACNKFDFSHQLKFLHRDAEGSSLNTQLCHARWPAWLETAVCYRIYSGGCIFWWLHLTLNVLGPLRYLEKWNRPKKHPDLFFCLQPIIKSHSLGVKVQRNPLKLAQLRILFHQYHLFSSSVKN